MSSWYNDNTGAGGIAVSTRIRLARNLPGIPFPAGMSNSERVRLNETVKAAIENSNTPFSKNLKYIDMLSVPENEAAAMAARHIISPEFAEDSRPRAVILSDDESISIMVGEEDHVRIQVIMGGMNLGAAYDTACLIDDLLYGTLHFAFDKKLGFLTACPTNLGTGLRASVMLHLPVCESSGEISALSDAVSKIGFTVRGIYGEGSRSAAAMYQVSNQITLGISEKNAIGNLEIITSQLMHKEAEKRAELNRIQLEDMCFRALGILENCRILKNSEMMNLLSAIKLGIDMGIIDKKINPVRLMIEGQPNMLVKKYGIMKPDEEPIYRAGFIRENL